MKFPWAIEDKFGQANNRRRDFQRLLQYKQEVYIH
jgi:hypothetical protein